MTRFYFHTADHADEEGTELADVAAAKCEAARYAGALVCDEASRFWESPEVVLTVTDAAGRILFTLRVSGQEGPPTGA